MASGRIPSKPQPKYQRVAIKADNSRRVQHQINFRLLDSVGVGGVGGGGPSPVRAPSARGGAPGPASLQQTRPPSSNSLVNENQSSYSPTRQSSSASGRGAAGFGAPVAPRAPVAPSVPSAPSAPKPSAPPPPPPSGKPLLMPSWGAGDEAEEAEADPRGRTNTLDTEALPPPPPPADAEEAEEVEDLGPVLYKVSDNSVRPLPPPYFIIIIILIIIFYFFYFFYYYFVFIN